VTDLTYATISDAAYFPGTVALINSLRLTGNNGEVLVLDNGLTREQVAALEPHATIARAPDLHRKHVPLLKPMSGKLASSSDVVMLVDSDMIICSSLAEIAAHAQDGKIFVYPDHYLARERQHLEWAQTFGLRAPLRRQTYVNAGFMAFSPAAWPDLLARFEELCERLPAEAQFLGVDSRQPFWAADQDALNALLMSEIPAESVTIGSAHDEAYWDVLREVRVDDEEHLVCIFDHERVKILHYSFGPKPWQQAAWKRMRVDDAYIRLMRRVLFGKDIALRIARKEVPFWVRSTWGARAATTALSLGVDIASVLKRSYLQPLLSNRR
jgi:hypothetical protein